MEWYRKPTVKIITRVILYGLSALCAKLGVSAAQAQDAATAIAEGVASLLFLFIGALIDKWHHRRDTNAGND